MELKEIIPDVPENDGSDSAKLARVESAKEAMFYLMNVAFHNQITVNSESARLKLFGRERAFREAFDLITEALEG